MPAGLEFVCAKDGAQRVAAHRDLAGSGERLGFDLPLDGIPAAAHLDQLALEVEVAALQGAKLTPAQPCEECERPESALIWGKCLDKCECPIWRLDSRAVVAHRRQSKPLKGIDQKVPSVERAARHDA